MRFWWRRKEMRREEMTLLPPKIKMSCCFCKTMYFNSEYHGYPTDLELEKFFQSKRSCRRCNAIIRNGGWFLIMASPELVFEDEECKVSKSAENVIKSKRKNWYNKYVSCLLTYKSNKKLNIQPISVLPPSQKCFNCFSVKHNTEFCDEKSLGPNFFLPKIDHDLLPRFTEILNEIEKYLFGLSSETASKYVQMKPLIVAQSLTSTDLIEFMPYFENANILVSKSLTIIKKMDSDFNPPYPYFTNIARNIIFSSVTSKTLLINVEIVVLSDIQISSEIFRLLLSRKTTAIYLSAVTITTAMKFSELIQICPNLEKFYYEEFYYNIFYYNRCELSELIFDNSWIENALNNWKSLKNFEAPLKYFNLTTECLPFLKQNIEIKDKVMRRFNLNFNAIKNDDMREKLSNFSIELLGEIIAVKKL